MNSSNINHHAVMPSCYSGRRHRTANINIRNFFAVLWRRKFLIIFVVLLCLGTVSLYVKNLVPQYTAKSSILIENAMSSNNELRSFVPSTHVDMNVVLSEAEVIKSHALARSVIDRLALINDPEFNPALRVSKSNIMDKFFNNDQAEKSLITNKNFKQLSVYKTETGGVSKNFKNQDMALVVDAFLNHLKVSVVPGSFVLQIEYNSTDPAKATLIANTIVDVYIKQNMDIKSQATGRITKWIEDRLHVLRTQAHDAANMVEKYKLENNLHVKDIVNFNEQQLSELRDQLMSAKRQKAEARERLNQIQNWVEHPDKIKSTKEAKNSRAIEFLKLKEFDTLKEISDLSVNYGDKYPRMVSKKEELEEIRAQLKQELTVIAQSIKTSLNFASKRVQGIENTLKNVGVVEGVGNNNSENVHLHKSVREAKAAQAALQNFLQKYKHSIDLVDVQESQVRVISEATIPIISYYPNGSLLIKWAVAISFFLGIVLAFILEKMISVFRTSEHIEEETGHSCLALVPFVPNLEPKKPIADYILSKDGHRMAETMRTLRMVINLRSKNLNQKSKVISVTSCVPEEGKTTLSAWIARVVAKSGERVIVLDCDLRRPRLHTAFGKNPQNTLVEYLTGKCTLEEATYRDPGTNMHAVFARSVPNNALDLITKSRMTNLIEALREQYDLIILDSPACLAVSDARLIASKSDQTVFAVSWDDTPIEVVNAGLKQFADVGHQALSLVLTNVDLKKYAKYGISDAAHYYSAYNPYYAD
jgi:capsular exopolysaccharide synthesis family protein